MLIISKTDKLILQFQLLQKLDELKMKVSNVTSMTNFWKSTR